MCLGDNESYDSPPSYYRDPPPRPVYRDGAPNRSNSSLKRSVPKPTLANGQPTSTNKVPASMVGKSKDTQTADTAKKTKSAAELQVTKPNKSDRLPPNPTAPFQIPLTGANIEHALKHADDFLRQRRQTFKIIARGEVVKALRLGRHTVAKNLNFFEYNLNEVEVKTVANAFEHAQQMTGIPLLKGWMESNILQRTSESQRRLMTKLAFGAPNEPTKDPLFKGEYLQVFEVPLSYNFVCYACRLETPHENAKDFDLAVDYLHARMMCRPEGPFQVQTYFAVV